MKSPQRSLNPSQAAAHLGVSAKALRLYEDRGLITPGRTAAGWRTYEQGDLTRAAEVIALRRLGLSLSQIGRVINGDPKELEVGLSAHEAQLRRQAHQIAAALERVRSLRSDMLKGHTSHPAKLAQALAQEARLTAGFELPWPWGGEWFEVRNVGFLNFITGPLGSGKTRFTARLAETLPDAAFLGLDRLTNANTPTRLAQDPALAGRVEVSLNWLTEDGAEKSDALIALIAALEAETPSILVIDMIEEGLSEVTQEALIAHLRLRASRKRALFLKTRSSSILDLDAIGVTETVIMCPANHSSPMCIVPYPGGRGYEATASCLAAPDVRARTAGTVAIRPQAT